MDSGKVTVVLAGDNGYALPLTVAARSVAASFGAGRELELCVLDMGIDEEHRARMASTFALPGVTLRWIDSLAGRVEEFPNTWPVITRATYARLFLPEVLPEVDRVVYLDCDVLVRRDLAELHDADMSGNWVLASPDVQAPFVPFGVPHWFEQGRSAADLNFNAGVLLVDLAAWREHDVTDRLLEYLTGGQHLRAQDQEAINAVLAGRIGEMDPRWNQQAEIFWKGIQYHYEDFLPYCAQTLATVRHDPWIVHFSSLPKPWRYDCEHPYLDEWFATLDLTAYAGWRPPAPGRLRQVVRRLGRRSLQHARRIMEPAA